MDTSPLVKSLKLARDHSITNEQTLCLEALESGAYDDMSDQEWVALCEKLASDSRHPDDMIAEADRLQIVSQLMAPKEA
jgi:hypothetical protein